MSKKPSQAQWLELQMQYERTPALNETNAPSGEHYRLAEILRRIGRVATTNEEILRVAGEVLSNGWAEETRQSKKENKKWFNGLFGGNNEN
jgi:hypothetical protein